MYYNNNVINMLEIFSKISSFIDMIINSLGVMGPVLGCLLIILESIIPILPLFAFITLNFMVFGNIVGFIISWVCTIIGCSISFYMFDNGVKGWFEKRLRNKEPVNKIMKLVDNIKFEQLVMLLAIPFTPAFAINIAAGLSNIQYKKYLKALLIGKVFLVYFWGFVGTSLIDSLTHPIKLVKIVVMVLIAYIVSKIVNKKLKID